MRLTKRQLKRIIREEYSRLKRQGLIREMDQEEDLEDEEEMSDEELNMRADYGLDEPRKFRRSPDFHMHERRRRRSAIRETFHHAESSEAACIDECFAAIPPMMKQICKMGMAHTVTNDIYHICEPICRSHGCDPDHISQIVEDMCCGR